NEYLSGEGVDSRHGLLVLDLDNFKLVNDNWGHKSGDDLLQLIAKTLKESVRASDIVGRIGGDEFVALLKNIDSATDVIDKANVIRSRIKAIRLDEAGGRFIPAFSVGIGLYPEHGNAYENIFELADAAMYYVKNHGKDGVKLS
ncbi:MAG TPA: GGDEF domain-containing protein, partial [Syntrophomonas sp.]|nr:GGDEF domain-containing protein [Syntrophomonas sp.]